MSLSWIMAKQKLDEMGAEFLEFALALPLFVALFIFFFDAGVLLHRYMRLTHATREATRVLSTEVGEMLDISAGRLISCDLEVRNWACRTLADYLDRHSAVTDEFVFRIDQLQNSYPFPVIGVSGTWSGRCITCGFFRDALQLGSHSVLDIEYRINIPDSCTLPFECV